MENLLLRRGLYCAGALVLVAVLGSGCGIALSPGVGKAKKRAADLQVHLTAEAYKPALDMCTKTAVWERLDGKSAPIKYFFLDLKAIERKKSFAIDVKGDRKISATKVILTCDMRQQIVTGITDVGNKLWKAQIFWEQQADGSWKIYKIKDVSKRVDKRSK